MIQDDKFYQDQKNYSRNDSGLGADAKNQGIAQINGSQDVNGSSNKPYPTERNFVVDANATIPNQMTEPTPAMGGNPANDHFGQVKYAKRAGVASIYKDETRYTANDKQASIKAESSTVYEVEDENEDSIGI